MRFARLTGLALALVLVPSVVPLFAQADTGTIDGRVYDEQKAGMPGVTVTAKNTATGLTRTVQSSPEGTYRFQSLPAGTYDVSAEIQGFAKQLRQGVIVQVTTATTVDFTMKLGSLSETVVVTGETPLIQTTRSDVGQVITSAMVENMPLNGRKFQDLSLMVPGTRPSNYYDPTKTEVGGISYGGLTGRSVNISVDGGDNNDGVVRGLLQQFSADAIQEYKVTTERYSAEFGRSTGGLVNVITKSGSNDLHGTAFVFGRNENLNSETYFEKQAGTGKQPFSQQQAGGTVGGPIKKDKAFYFFSYEYNRRQDYATVFTNHVLPDQEGAQLKPFRDQLLTAKTDFQINDNNRLLVRYSLEDQKRQHDFIGGKTLQSAGASNDNLIHSVIAKNSTTFGNSKLNEAVVLFQYFKNDILADNPNVPDITTPDFVYGANINTPQQTIQRRWQFRDDFSFRKTGWGGDHDFKAGGEVIRSHFGGFFTPTLYGFFNFATSLPGGLNTYLNSIADSFTGSAGSNVADDNWTYVASYFQDDFKPSQRLTLNLGLRWEAQMGPYQNNFDTLALRSIAAAGYNTKRSQDWKDIGPRAGFAYDLLGDGKTVVRGGYGIYYDEIFQNITLYEKWSNVATPLFFVSASPAPFTPSYYAANREAIRNSFIDPTFSGQVLRLTAPDLKQPYSHQFNVGFSHEITRNVSFDADYIHSIGEREIGRWRINTAANVNTRLSPAGVFDPALGPIQVEGNRGHSRIDGLLMTGKVRMRNAQVITTYSLTKGMNINNDFLSQPGDTSNAGNWESDWGPMPNDVRHRFTAAVVLGLPGGFQYSTGIQANTGKPYNPVAGYSGGRNAVRAIDPATGVPFARNSFTGPGYATWDMRIAKDFTFGKARSFEVLFEVFNATDRVNFSGDPAYGFNNAYGPNPTPNANFGTATQIVPNSNRQAEFGIRYRF